MLVRNRYVPIPGAVARRGVANTWEVRIPRTAEVARALRVPTVSLEAFDGAEFSVEGVASTQAIGCSETDDVVVVTLVM